MFSVGILSSFLEWTLNAPHVEENGLTKMSGLNPYLPAPPSPFL